MLLRTTTGLLAAIIVTASVRSQDVSVSEPGARCSVDFGASVRADLFFVGTALPDTVQAGRGATVPIAAAGHFGPGRPREVHGQLVRVDLLNSDAPADLKAALDRTGSPNVVIVPWDYTAACDPTYWSGSARWIEPGPEAFYAPTLRDREHWVGSYPTFDAFFADLHPYPLGRAFRDRAKSTTAGPWLRPRELFAMYSAMPSQVEIETSSRVALERILAWEAANPAMAARYPAKGSLSIAKEQITKRR